MVGEIVSIVKAREDRARATEAAQVEAFELYKERAFKAQRTLNLQDAMEAGKAWGEFIALFVRQS